MTTRDRTRTNTHHARTHTRDRPGATLRPANWLALAPDCVEALWAPQRPPELLLSTKYGWIYMKQTQNDNLLYAPYGTLGWYKSGRN
jgi:hypothetical protein